MVERKQASFHSMIVTVDANILFSALISANGRIARLLTDPSLAPTRQLSLCSSRAIQTPAKNRQIRQKTA